ncbi:hypothetical protein PCYB_114980 [Plasmodium cynomolgi strain B]|uniref:Uncharacterized protein n=1 Tax=Plasmodium cynomolgi (strain B) TaxID=1120755 RepID=K6UL71_PLACD|nr:hypothetical protein PCYB_114980 [Plasmodium cynomolgi strain B]GAB67478.1 hypothetical protein PCYB_114980 [Plasmodium cynomolgi strain B]
MKTQEINGQIIAQGNYTRRAFQTNNIKIKTSSIVSTIERIQTKNSNILTLNENLISKIRSDGLEIIKKEGEILDVNSKNVCYALKNGKFRLINQNGVNTTRIKLPYDNEVLYVTFNKENGKFLLLLDNKGHLYVYSINEYKVELIFCLNFPPYQKKSSSWTSFTSSNNDGIVNTLKSGLPLKASWLPKSDNFFLTGHNNCLYIWNISLLINVMTAKKWKDEVDVTDQLVAGCAVTLLFEPIMCRYRYVCSKEEDIQSGCEVDNTSHDAATEEKTLLNSYCMSLNGKYLLALVNNHYAIIWELQRSNQEIKFTLVGFSSLKKELKQVKAMLQTGGSQNGDAEAMGQAEGQAAGLQPSEANRGSDQHSRRCIDVEISSVHILNSFFQANESGEGTNQSTYYLLVFHSSCCISVFPFNNKCDPSGGDTTERIDILRQSSVQNIFVERDNVSIENIELFVDPSEFFVFFNISYRAGDSHAPDTSRSLIFILEIFNKKRLDFKIHPKFVHLPNNSILPLCSIRLIKTNECLKFSKVLNVSVSSSSLNIINLFMFSIIFNSSKKSGDANRRSDEACVSIRKRLEDLMGKGDADEAVQPPHAAEEGAYAPENQLMGHPEVENLNALTSERNKAEQLEMAWKVCEGGRDVAFVRGFPDGGLESAGSNFYVEDIPTQNEKPVEEMQRNEKLEKLEEQQKGEEVENTKRLALTMSHRSSRNEVHSDALFSSMEGGKGVALQGETNQVGIDIPLSLHVEAKTEINEQEEKKTVEHNSNIDIIMSTHEDALRRFMECEDGGDPSEMDHPEKSDEESIPKVDTQDSANDGEVAVEEQVPLEGDIEQNESYDKQGNEGGMKKEKNLNSFLHKLGFFKSSPSTYGETAAEEAARKVPSEKKTPTIVSSTNQGGLPKELIDETEKEKQLEELSHKGKNKSDECSEVCETRGREHLVLDPTEGGTLMVGNETKRMVKKEESDIIGLNKCSNKEREGVTVKADLSNSTPWDLTGEGQTGKTSDDTLKQLCREICRKVSDQMADMIYKEIRTSGVESLTKGAAARGQFKKEGHLEGSINRGGEEEGGEKKSYEEMAAMVSNCERRVNEMMEEMSILRNGNKNMNGKILSIGTTVEKIYDAVKGGGPHPGGSQSGGPHSGGVNGHGVYPRGQKTSGYEGKVEKLISEMSAFKKGMYNVTSKLSETLSCMSEDLKSSFAKSLKGNNEQLKRWALHDVRHGRRDEEGEAYQMGTTAENGVDYDVDHDRATGQAGKKHTLSFNKDMADFFNSAHQNAVKKIMPAVISSEIQIQFAKSVIPGMKEAYNTGFQSMKESLNSLLTENKQWLSISKILCESLIKTSNLTMEEADFRMKWVQECLQQLDVNHSDLVKTNSYIFVKNMVNNISAFSYLVGKEIGKLNDSLVNLANLDLNRRIFLNEDSHFRDKKVSGMSGVEETESLASRNLYLGSPQKYYLHNKNMLVALQERLMLIRKLLKRYY